MANEEYTGGAGGKFRRKVLRMTPYDRPAIKNPNPNPNNTSFLSRLIYAVTCAFWKRITGASEPKGWSIANISAAEISHLETMLKQKTFTRYEIERLTRLGEGDKANISIDSHVLRLKASTRTNEEQMNTGSSEPKGWSIANISAEISHLETMLKQKTFTRYEIERLTRLGEGDKANISIDSHVLRLKASTSGPLNKHSEKTENFHAVISTPTAFEEDVASRVELAKARSRGRSAMYRIACAPYYRGP
nr:hypothetical protein [Tanacetum cinerariifolium]